MKKYLTAAEIAKNIRTRLNKELPGYKFNGLFIEMKYGKNRLTDEQKEFGDHVSKQGYCTAVAYSAEEAIEIIDDYLSM